jgi:hypothetical protein
MLSTTQNFTTLPSKTHQILATTLQKQTVFKNVFDNAFNPFFKMIFNTCFLRKCSSYQMGSLQQLQVPFQDNPKIQLAKDSSPLIAYHGPRLNDRVDL